MCGIYSSGGRRRFYLSLAKTRRNLCQYDPYTVSDFRALSLTRKAIVYPPSGQLREREGYNH
jgi:hypothetical protein